MTPDFDEERDAVTVIAHMEEGLRQAERGELISAEQSRLEMEKKKQLWREGKLARRSTA